MFFSGITVSPLSSLSPLLKSLKIHPQISQVRMKHINKHTGIVLCCHDKEEYPTVCQTWVDLEGIVVREISQTKKYKILL